MSRCFTAFPQGFSFFLHYSSLWGGTGIHRWVSNGCVLPLGAGSAADWRTHYPDGHRFVDCLRAVFRVWEINHGRKTKDGRFDPRHPPGAQTPGPEPKSLRDGLYRNGLPDCRFAPVSAILDH